MGWLTRKFGLSLDNLISAEVVTADGQVRRASAADERPALFWAIRGGGGNFGVITSFEFQLHDLDPTVQLGLFFWGLDQGEEALRLAREWPPACRRDQRHDRRTECAAGPVRAAGASLLAGLRAHPDRIRVRRGHATPSRRRREQIRNRLPPLFDLVTPMPYVELQQMLDEANAWGSHGYEKGTYLEDLTDAVIDVLTKHVAAQDLADVNGAALPSRRRLQPGR